MSRRRIEAADASTRTKLPFFSMLKRCGIAKRNGTGEDGPSVGSLGCARGLAGWTSLLAQCWRV